MTNLSFSDQLDHLPQSPDWLAELRQKAATRFRETGMPSPRDESWKYTDLRVLQSLPAPKSRIDVPAALLPNAVRFAFVSVDGMISEIPGQKPFGVTAGSINVIDVQAALAKIAPENQALSALNTALFNEGLAVIVADDVTVEQPIEVCFTGMDAAHLRLLVILGKNSSATLIETHYGHNQRTIVSEIDLATSAKLQHYRLQSTEDDAVVLATGGIKLAKDALYDGFALTTGARLSRHQITATLNGPGGEVRLNGAHVLSGQSHADTTTEIIHAAPNCRSRETYRHVMDGTSRSVFQGKIFVAQDAQKTDGFQLNQSLMLSPTAEVNAKPELEIYADDVKCSHGATSGRLDEEALFYLRSRGIPKAEARQILIEAFIGSSIDMIEHEAVREAFRAHATKVLGEGR